MTKEDEGKFQKGKVGHVCDKKYTDKDIRVRDHCHITGKFRVSSHQVCNLKLRVNPEEMKNPGAFHNLRGDDSRFKMQEFEAIVKKHTYNSKGDEFQINMAPVLKIYTSHCVKDSFTFANFIQNYDLETAKTFLCSFDISSLFTNVPLDKTIEICTDALYRDILIARQSLRTHSGN